MRSIAVVRIYESCARKRLEIAITPYNFHILGPYKVVEVIISNISFAKALQDYQSLNNTEKLYS
ncbi:hypothetical protein GKR41_00747 [Candidatus Vallotia lariciata]|nr:hypothetical protein GKR41_00747 [Candidatus Vallotia lariciata]